MGIINTAAMAIQIWLLVKSRRKVQDVKSFSIERPTYNVLTVIILRFLQALLLFGVVIQGFRSIFYFCGNSFDTFILLDHFSIYYAYQVFMQFLPFMIEYVYLVQIFEWQAMIFVIVT